MQKHKLQHSVKPCEELKLQYEEVYREARAPRGKALHICSQDL